MASNFSNSAEIYTYNGSVYRQITMDANKRLAFMKPIISQIQAMVLNIYALFMELEVGVLFYFKLLPVVYSNSKSCNFGSDIC